MVTGVNVGYNNNIPAAPNNPSNDQPLMQTNTNSIRSVFEVDHVGFDSAPNQGGFHKQVTLVNGNAPGSPAGVGVLFGFGGGGFLGFQLPSSAPGTNFVPLLTSSPLANSNGYSNLPGAVTAAGKAMIIEWGNRTLDGNGVSIRNDSPFTFHLPFTNIFSIVLSAAKTSTGAEGLWIKDGTLTPSGFTIKTSASAGQFTHLYFIAIGN